MNAGEWEAGEIRRLSTAATNGDGVHAGAASVVKIPANVNSGKMTIKVMERERKCWEWLTTSFRTFTWSWLVVLNEIELESSCRLITRGR